MKTKKQEKVSIKLLGKILTMVVITLISLISFLGIYVKDKNTVKNIVPDYKLGMDLGGSRNIVISVNDNKVTKRYDKDGKIVTDDSIEDENIKEVEEPINNPELLTKEHYKEVKDIIEDRLDYMKVKKYLLSCDEDTGKIKLEIPENGNTDYIAQYTITKGEFRISDADTLEVLVTNDDVKDAKVQYGSTEKGLTAYLTIEFNKEGRKKIQEISKKYISTKDEEGKDIVKKIKITLDNSEILSTYFQEEITDGKINLTTGTSSNPTEFQTYISQASNIAVFLNTKPMPITYKMDENRFVYSDITTNNINGIIIISIIIFIIMALVMIIKYNKNGLIGVISNIGFIAILLLAVRFGNVPMTLMGIATIIIVEVVEYVITMLILKEYNKEVDKELKKKNIKQLLKKISINLMPLIIMAITFSMFRSEDISTVGMIIFWSILVMLIYNIIILFSKVYTCSKIKNKKDIKK